MTARPASRLAHLAAAAALGLALAACSGASETSSAVAPAGAGVVQDGVAPADQGAPAAGSGAAVAGSKAVEAGATKGATKGATVLPGAPTGRALARTAALAVTVPDVTVAAQKVRTITAGAKGLVLQEALYSGADQNPKPGTDSKLGAPSAAPGSTMVLEIPTTGLDTVLDQLGALGHIESRSASTEDLTTGIVDVQSRLTTMKASLARVRALMDKATTLSQVVDLEAQVAQREADLESLTATLAAMQGRVDTATVTLTLMTAGSAATTEADSGFLSGLRAGWEGLVKGTAVALTVLGLALPFLLVAAAIGIPLLRWRRRQREAGQLHPTQPAPATAQEAERTPVGV